MTIKVGDKVVFINPYGYAEGEFTEDAAEEEMAFSYNGDMHGFVFQKKEGVVGRYDESDNSYRVDGWWYGADELKLADAPAPAAEVKSPVARIKPIYVVEDGDGDELIRTRSREFAREIKSYYGGKAKGVRIIQYAAVKEIR